MKNVVTYVTSAIHNRVSDKHLKGGGGGGGHCSPLGWAIGVGDGGATSG